MTTARPPVVVDTNALLYAIGGHTLATRFQPYLLDRPVYASFHTVAELRLMARRRNWGAARLRRLEEAVQSLVIAPPEEDIVEHWVDVMLRQERAGRRLDAADAWVAATALAYGFALVTNDHDVLDVLDLEVLSPL